MVRKWQYYGIMSIQKPPPWPDNGTSPDCFKYHRKSFHVFKRTKGAFLVVVNYFSHTLL